LEIKQIKLTKMATFCYLVGDESSKTCALIDPAFDTKKILDEVKKGGYELTHVINTHCHSDCLLYTSPSPRDGLLSRMPSSA